MTYYPHIIINYKWSCTAVSSSCTFVTKHKTSPSYCWQCILCIGRYQQNHIKIIHMKDWNFKTRCTNISCFNLQLWWAVRSSSNDRTLQFNGGAVQYIQGRWPVFRFQWRMLHFLQCKHLKYYSCRPAFSVHKLHAHLPPLLRSTDNNRTIDLPHWTMIQPALIISL